MSTSSMLSAETTEEVRLPYSDRLFRSVISAPIAAYMMLYREKAGFFEAFFDFNFWIGMAFSYVITLMLLWLLNRLAVKLDRLYDWRRDTLKRILHQFAWGVVGIALLTFILVTIYFSLFGINILETSYLRYDYPLVVLIIVLGNLYYLVHYLWQIIDKGDVVEAGKHVLAGENGNEQQVNGSNGEKGLFLAQTKEAVLVIPQSRIAAVYRQGDYVLLRTFDRETYTLEQPITKVLPDLNSHYFFKINPRYIVSYKLCKSFRNGTYGKLDIELGAPFNSTESVSRTLAGDFEKWMDR